jgi:glycosyltransferase involved in cell wall biosynthesis
MSTSRDFCATVRDESLNDQMRQPAMSFLILNDIPTPWREPVFEKVFQKLGDEVEFAYFKNNEKRRLWTFNMGAHPRKILKAITLSVGGIERFLNPGIVSLMLRKRPRAILIFAGLKDPTTWLTVVICRLLGTKIALLDDSWLGRDREIGFLQRKARHAMYNWFGDAFIGASLQTLSMFRHYNHRILDAQCFLSHLVADNEYFESQLSAEKPTRRFDVMFSGRIVGAKNPVFFAEVCAGIKERIGRCRALVIGDGDPDLKEKMKECFQNNGVSFEFAGFIPHAELPGYYAQSRLLLLPTSGDCWGVVLNEAMVAGTPVITTEWTAAAGELVIHERNGYVLPLDVDTWASAASQVLSCEAKWGGLSNCARHTVKDFNFDRAADGIIDALNYLAG